MDTQSERTNSQSEEKERTSSEVTVLEGEVDKKIAEAVSGQFRELKKMVKKIYSLQKQPIEGNAVGCINRCLVYKFVSYSRTKALQCKKSHW